MALTYSSKFCKGGDPYAGITWTKRDAKIAEKIFDADWKPVGEKVVFHQKEIEAPDFWSDKAVQITAQKYFRGKLNADGTPHEGRETSMRQLVDRVVDTIAMWAGYKVSPVDFVHERTVDCDLAIDEVYFEDYASWEAWKNDLKVLLIRQYMWFNSPVWFNVGVDPRPQCSACFILRVNDQMSSGSKGGDFNIDDHGLAAWQVKETLIFTNGSGAGVNLSRIRSDQEWLSGGGKPTGPLSFAEGPDAWAACVKSGGKSRRAAKMLILDVDHPNIREFIRVKAEEEKIAKILIANGYPSDMDGVAYRHARHQNSNLSVRTNDDFMRRVEDDIKMELVSRTSHFLDHLPRASMMIGGDGRVLETPFASDIARLIADQCWQSGDPGMQYADTINKWHTCADTDQIYASNPCSEYLFLDETSCNLASLNLRRWFPVPHSYDSHDIVADFEAGIYALTIAMDAIVSGARYPTENIRKESQKYRTLGVGFANLGGMLMAHGIPYDSKQGRDLCASISALMTGAVYETGTHIAAALGSFAGYAANKSSFKRVMQQHCDAAYALPKSYLASRANMAWTSVLMGANAGLARNAQATVLAPTGTIAFSMDAETTGIEPELGLVKFKQLSGGGNMSITNPLVETSLHSLGYTSEEAARIAQQVLDVKGAVRKVPGLLPHHYKVFETSNPPTGDPEFFIPWEAHIKMMAAAQPFISGAISKTINMPNSATKEQIWDAYHLGWKLGLKAVAIYRDGSKGTQPLSTTEQKVNQEKIPSMAVTFDKPPKTLVLPDAEKMLADWSAERSIFIEQIKKLTEALAQRPRIQRMKPPREYHDMSRIKFEIGGHEGYLMVGFYPGTHDPCEAFVEFSKPGSTVQGIMNAWMIAISIMLQAGYPFEDILRKFEHIDFEPKGMTGDSDVRIARSVVDFVVRKMSALSQHRGPKTLTITEPERTVAQPVFGEDLNTNLPLRDDLVATNEVKPRNAGVACLKCGSPNVVLNKNCTTCTDCGSSEGGCFG